VRELALRLAPGKRLGRREHAGRQVPEPLLSDPTRDGDFAAHGKDLEHQSHRAVAPPAMGITLGHQVVLKLAREQWPVSFELTHHVASEAGVRFQEIAYPEVARQGVRAPVLRHPRADERQVFDRVDERVVLEELPLLPEQPVELGAVVGTEAAEEDELLGGCHGRDRVHLQEAELPDRVENRRGGAVEELGAHGDPPRLFERNVGHARLEIRTGRCYRPGLERRLARNRAAEQGVVVEQPNQLITRAEVVAGLFAVHDILEDVREIRSLLGGDDGEEEEEPEDQS